LESGDIAVGEDLPIWTKTNRFRLSDKCGIPGQLQTESGISEPRGIGGLGRADGKAGQVWIVILSRRVEEPVKCRGTVGVKWGSEMMTNLGYMIGDAIKQEKAKSSRLSYRQNCPDLELIHKFLFSRGDNSSDRRQQLSILQGGG
jgi:hypothetical protein